MFCWKRLCIWSDRFPLIQSGWGCEALCDLQDVHRLRLRWALQPVLIAERAGPPLSTHIPDPAQPAAECNPGLARSQPKAQLRHTSTPPWWHFSQSFTVLALRTHQYGHCYQDLAEHRLVLSQYEKQRSELVSKNSYTGKMSEQTKKHHWSTVTNTALLISLQHNLNHN